MFTWARSQALRGTWPRTLAEDGPTSPAWEEEVRRYALELSPDAPLQSATRNRRTDSAAAAQLVRIVEELDHHSLIAWTTMLITNILDAHTVREFLRGHTHALQEQDEHSR